MRGRIINLDRDGNGWIQPVAEDGLVDPLPFSAEDVLASDILRVGRAVDFDTEGEGDNARAIDVIPRP